MVGASKDTIPIDPRGDGKYYVTCEIGFKKRVNK